MSVTLISIFRLLAGVGLFLFAMYLLEEALKNLAGRNFKLFLKKVTKHSLTAVVGGAAITAILQSSSMISIMVLAFVNAGVFATKEALSIILGANLGTTLDSWMVATLGFKMNIEIIAYPAVFLGGLLLIVFNKSKNIKYASYFLLGFGMLFISLNFMKTAMETQVSNFNFLYYENMPLIIFLVLGFLITLLVQSSSVVMALTLSALHVGGISFLPAVAIVLGSETGTTIKIVLSAIGGDVTKKRVVLGNLIFNIVLTIGAFVFIHPIVNFILNVLNIKNELLGLVTFSSLVNLVSIIIFIPFLAKFSKFLDLFFVRSEESTLEFLRNSQLQTPTVALKSFKKETNCFIHYVMVYNLSKILNTSYVMPLQHTSLEEIQNSSFYTKTTLEQYNFIKLVQGEMQAYYLLLREKITVAEKPILNQMIISLRSSIYATKSMTDNDNNIDNLNRSSKLIKFNFLQSHQHETEILYKELNQLMILQPIDAYEQLSNLYKLVLANFSTSLAEFYEQLEHNFLEDIDLTLVINFNRELFTSNKAILIAVKDFLLQDKEAIKFNQILVYRT
jgi:phosphate:Na+ symporter